MSQSSCSAHVHIVQSTIDPRPQQALPGRAFEILLAALSAHGISVTDTSEIETEHHKEANGPGLLGELS